MIFGNDIHLQGEKNHVFVSTSDEIKLKYSLLKLCTLLEYFHFMRLCTSSPVNLYLINLICCYSADSGNSLFIGCLLYSVTNQIVLWAGPCVTGCPITAKVQPRLFHLQSDGKKIEILGQHSISDGADNRSTPSP